MSQLTYIDTLVLLALHDEKETAVTPAKAAGALKAIVKLSSTSVTASLQRLAATGSVEELPRKKGQRAFQWRLRAEGREALASQLKGVKMQGRGWRTPAARILAAIHVLKLDPHLASAVKGEGLLVYFLAKRLGEEFDASTTLVALARRVAASELQLSRGDTEFIWKGVISQGLASPAAEPSVGAAQTGAGSGTHDIADLSDSAALTRFVDDVKRAGRHSKDGWSGSRKLLIHRAWEVWRAGSTDPADLGQFKDRLLRALRAGLVELARADFPMGIEQAELDAALINYGHERFHFITFSEEARP